MLCSLEIVWIQCQALETHFLRLSQPLSWLDLPWSGQGLMLVSGYEELSRRSVGDGNGIWLFCCFDGSLLPFLIPSLPSSLPGLWISCGGEVSKPPRGGGTPTWGLMSLQEESRRMSSVSTQGALAKPGTAMTPSGGSRLPVTSL